jgi:ABC-type transporter MlaC component
MKFMTFHLYTLLLILSLSVKAQTPSTPELFIKNTFQLAQKENPLANSKLKAELDSQFDFKTMSFNILGKEEAKKLSPQDLVWFEKSIQEIITKTVYPKAPEFLRGVKITYNNPIFDENKVLVPSVVTKKGEKTDVQYSLIKTGESWKIIDVSIDEESWVQSINEKMKKTIKEKGFKGVRDLLNKRIKELAKK